MTVTNDGGNSFISKTITMNHPVPVPDFIGTPTSGNTPLTVQFTDKSTGANITGWSWTFGDGGTSPSQNPSHIYSAAGIYTVSMTSTNDGGSQGITKTGYITVHNATPSAKFTANVSTGNVPKSIKFTDTSTGTGITSWSWVFGDGGTSTQQSPIYEYNKSGVYYVTLTVMNDGGSSTSASTKITITDVPLNALFSGTPVVGNQPLTVQFTDASTGDNINGWQWNFGDTLTSTQQSPSHIYSSYGLYTVTLKITNATGSSTLTKIGYILVHNATPVANFVSNVTTGNPPTGHPVHRYVDR